MPSKLPVGERRGNIPESLRMSDDLDMRIFFGGVNLPIYPLNPIDFTECECLSWCDGCRIFNHDHEYVRKNCLNLKKWGAVMESLMDGAFERHYGVSC